MRGAGIGALAAHVDAFERQVLHVGVRRRHAPGDPRVVTERNEGHAGNRDPGHIQARGDEMHLVPHGREFDLQVRIVREKGPPSLRASGCEDPVVAVATARTGGKPLEPGRNHSRDRRRSIRWLRRTRQCVEDRGSGSWIQSGQLPRGTFPELLCDRGANQFCLVILGEAPCEQPAHRQRINGRPVRRRNSENLELDRTQTPGHLCRDRVHARRIAFERSADLRRCAFPLGSSGIAKANRQEPLIERDCRVAERLRQPPCRDAAIQLHLPAAIARVHDAGREPRHVLVGRIDVRHTVTVEDHLNRRVQPGHGDLAVKDRKGAADPPPAGNPGRDHHHQRQNDEQSFHRCTCRPRAVRLGWGAGQA